LVLKVVVGRGLCWCDEGGGILFGKCGLGIFFSFDGRIEGSGIDKLTSFIREGNNFKLSLLFILSG
jgi:hypothetical protein